MMYTAINIETAKNGNVKWRDLADILNQLFCLDQAKSRIARYLSKFRNELKVFTFTLKCNLKNLLRSEPA